GEREEWINLRVALYLAEMLKEKGAKVILTRTQDINVDQSERAKMAIDNKADIFISIHHNATTDTGVNFPLAYYHGNASENLGGIQLGEILVKSFLKNLYETDIPACLISDFTILPPSGASVLRNSYGIPGIIGEASFFSNAKEEQKLKDKDYNKKEAEAYLKAIDEYFSQKAQPVLDKFSKIELPPFKALQEEEQMDFSKLSWFDNYQEASQLLQSDNQDSLLLAEKLLIQSVHSFPDSWIAGQAHQKRSEVLMKLKRHNEADTARMMAKEYYILISGTIE
ncbi:MAG: N-acetylmuramoyl-L-alanine amidase, partial [Bacteroidota bacterium]